MSIEEIFNKSREYLERVRATVNHILILGGDGVVLYSTTDATTTRAIAQNVCKTLVDKASSSIREVEATDQLKYMRVATKTFEILVVPDKDFTLVAVV